MDGRSELFETLDVEIGQQTSPVGSETKHQLASLAYRIFVRSDQIWQGLEAGFIIRMPKPVSLM